MNKEMNELLSRDVCLSPSFRAMIKSVLEKRFTRETALATSFILQTGDVKCKDQYIEALEEAFRLSGIMEDHENEDMKKQQKEESNEDQREEPAQDNGCKKDEKIKLIRPFYYMDNMKGLTALDYRKERRYYDDVVFLSSVKSRVR